MYTVRFYQKIHQTQHDDQINASLETLPQKNLYTKDEVEKGRTFYDSRDLCVWFEVELKTCPQIGWSIHTELEDWRGWEEIYSMVKNIRFYCKRDCLVVELGHWLTNFAEDISRQKLFKQWNL